VAFEAYQFGQLPKELKVAQSVWYMQPSGGRSADYSDNDDLLGVVVRICGSTGRFQERLERGDWALGTGRKGSIAATRLDGTA
jgi:hypothetical protein